MWILVFTIIQMGDEESFLKAFKFRSPNLSKYKELGMKLVTDAKPVS